MTRSPRRYAIVKEVIGFLVLIDGPLGVFIGMKIATEDWTPAICGLVLSAFLAWVYWKLYAWWLEGVSGHAKN